jgi:hypothetical protein
LCFGKCIFIRCGLAGYQKKWYLLNRNIFRSIDVLIYIEEQDADFEQSTHEPIMWRNEQTTSVEQTEFKDIQFSEATVSHKSTVATSNFPTATANSDTPTASSSRPFRAASLIPLPSVLEDVLDDVRRPRAGSANFLIACPCKAEFE